MLHAATCAVARPVMASVPEGRLLVTARRELAAADLSTAGLL